MSVSVQAWPGDLQTAESSTSLLPIDTLLLKQAEAGLHGCGECIFLLQLKFQFRLFFLGSDQSDTSDNLE
jgi:hypothetical protein